MASKYFILADHSIGYDCVYFLLQTYGKENLTFYTSETNSVGFWKPIESLVPDVHIFKSNRDFFKRIKSEKIDYILLLSWKHILNKEIISHPKGGVINLHYSLLPRHRGVYPVNWAIIEGDKKTGITFHHVNNEIDAGDIILQREAEIDDVDTAYSLLLKLDKLALSTFKQLMRLLEKGSVPAYSQSGYTSYHSKIDFEKINSVPLGIPIDTRRLFNLLRGKKFRDKHFTVYFYDDSLNQKFFIDLNI